LKLCGPPIVFGGGKCDFLFEGLRHINFGG
jgi:hypothetical protein